MGGFDGMNREEYNAELHDLSDKLAIVKERTGYEDSQCLFVLLILELRDTNQLLECIKESVRNPIEVYATTD